MEILLTIALVACIMGSMAVGVIFRRPPLRGSCGGVAGKACLCKEEGRPPDCKHRHPETLAGDAVSPRLPAATVLPTIRRGPAKK